MIYKLPVLGIGAVATKVESTDGLSTTSHDGKRMAFIRYDRVNQTDSLMVANATAVANQIVVTQMAAASRFGHPHKTVWTPDDRAVPDDQFGSGKC